METTRLRCVKCQVEFEAANPPAKIVNTAEICMVVMVPNVLPCPNPLCDAQYGTAFKAVKYDYAWIPIAQEEKKSSIIVPSFGGPRALPPNGGRRG